MYIELKELEGGWFDVILGLKTEDLDELIERLKMLKKDKKKVFHLINKFKEDKGISDVEFYMTTEYSWSRFCELE